MKLVPNATTPFRFARFNKAPSRIAPLRAAPLRMASGSLRPLSFARVRIADDRFALLQSSAVACPPSWHPLAFELDRLIPAADAGLPQFKPRRSVWLRLARSR